jgi:hypothetical protein
VTEAEALAVRRVRREIGCIITSSSVNEGMALYKLSKGVERDQPRGFRCKGRTSPEGWPLMMG